MLDQRDAQLISAQYALGGDVSVVGPTARGELGQVWRLTTDRGPWAVKEHFAPQEVADAAEDAVAQDAFRRRGVPMPAVVRTVGGEVLSSISGTTFRVYEWVDLDESGAALDPALIGAAIASIHRVVLQVCHCDLFTDNVRALANGATPTELCIIDWENCGWADPTLELAVALFEYGRDDAHRARRLYESYVDAGGPARVSRRGHFSMAIAQLDHIGERHIRLWHDPSLTDTARAHHEAGADEFLRDALTREVIDELLDAISGSRDWR